MWYIERAQAGSCSPDEEESNEYIYYSPSMNKLYIYSKPCYVNFKGRDKLEYIGRV